MASENDTPSQPEKKSSFGRIFDVIFVLVVLGVLYFGVFQGKSVMESLAAAGYVALVIVGLGLLIFIHELGHFVAAKACGVKVEAFSIGFGAAIPGCQFRYGETLYKIGKFPIGGYVKMLGQVDPGEEEEDPEGARTDPRSYMNKPVGQRMVIISAGVICNLALGLALFVWVYLHGKVEKVPRVSFVVPGMPASLAGVTAGSELLEVDGNARPIYDDLLFASALATPGQTQVHLKWKTPQGDVREASIVPVKSPTDTKPMLGLGAPRGLIVPRGIKDPADLAAPQSPAVGAGFQGGDRLVAVRAAGLGEFQPLANGWDLHRAEDAFRGKPVDIQVQRGDQTVTLRLGPAYVFSAGIQMTMGPILEVVRGPYAPPAALRLEKGDVIVAVNGDRAFDPLRLADLLQYLGDAGKDVTLTVRRGETEIAVPVTAKELAGRGTWSEGAFISPRGPGVPALGILYEVRPVVARAEPRAAGCAAGSAEVAQRVATLAGVIAQPTGLAGLAGAEAALAQGAGSAPRPGDKVVGGNYYLPPDPDAKVSWWKQLWASPPKAEFKPFDLDKTVWSTLFGDRQLGGTKTLVLRVERAGKEFPVAVTFAADPHWPASDRGLLLEMEQQIFVAENIREAAVLGLRDTYRFVGRIYMNLKSLITRDVSVQYLSGPIKMVEFTYRTAEQGWSEYLLFLAIISINLAVVNFLPIPILDGGHMMFLIWEKVRGKPAGDRAFAIANTIGLVVIASLMLFVIFMDLGGRRLLFAE